MRHRGESRESVSRYTTRARLKALGIAGVVAVCACMLLGGATGAAALTGAPTFWKVDLHQHSAFSGDARADIKLDATIDQTKGYNAVFLTDHDRLSSFQIAGANGNFLSYSEDLSTRFTAKISGTGSTPTVVTTQHHGGTKSLHLAATSNTASNARSFVYADRGAGLNSGNVTLDFWVLPQTINSGSGADVSVSLGGDSTTGTATYGYTNLGGTATPGKSTVLVWQLGSARAASSERDHRHLHELARVHRGYLEPLRDQRHHRARQRGLPPADLRQRRAGPA